MPLILIYGPMFAGKTTRMIEKASQYFSKENKKSLLVTCDVDTRDPIKRISSHFKFFTLLEDLFDVITLGKDNLNSLLSEMDLSKYSSICIDETQFFTKIWENINNISQNNIVICSGLKANFEKKPFGEFNDLFSLADETIECKALCGKCKNEILLNATHTRKIINDDSLILIGGKDVYEPVCSKHF